MLHLRWSERKRTIFTHSFSISSSLQEMYFLIHTENVFFVCLSSMRVYCVAVTLKRYVAVKVYVYFMSVCVSQGHCPCPVHTLHQRGLQADVAGQ